MHLELVVIGNEILSGATVNTNAAFIGKELLKAGYLIIRETVLPDQETQLKEGLSEALARSDLVICTGGLGPTLDDITRNVAASLFNSDFRYDDSVAKDIENRFQHLLPIVKNTLVNQATVPSKASILLNAVGTAPGLILKEGKKTLIMMPGVPYEMKAMCVNQVIPYIRTHFPIKQRSYRKALHFFELAESAVDPLLRELSQKYPKINFSIYPSLGLLTVHLSVGADNEDLAEKILSDPLMALKTQFATNCYNAETGAIEEAIAHIFRENGWTLSLAESCTGGQASSRITQLAGASDYFIGSIIPYTNTLKTKLLGVPENLITQHGAVSKEVVEKMVEGIIQETGSDFGLAVSGIAGPSGGTLEKPVGTVWCSICRKGFLPRTWKIQWKGTREIIITRSVNSLFSNLLTYTKETSLL